MNLDFDTLKDWEEFILSSIALIGILWGGWKWLITPLKSIVKKIEKMDSAIDCINDEILPVIQSLNKEFTKNSGKSIMDRILRIDDNTRLAELRSKLIASTLASASMCEFDRLGNLTWANKAFTNLTGLELASLAGNGWIVAIEENDRKNVWGLWRHSIENGIPFESEFTIKNHITDAEQKVKCQIYPHKSIDTNINSTPLGYYGSFDNMPD
jgi:hypothetical protein